MSCRTSGRRMARTASSSACFGPDPTIGAVYHGCAESPLCPARTARYNYGVEPTLRVIHGGREPARDSHAEPGLTELSGWGMHPRVQGRQRLSENLERITEGAVLTRGLGRSYGDASLPAPGGAPVAGSV